VSAFVMGSTQFLVCCCPTHGALRALWRRRHWTIFTVLLFTAQTRGLGSSKWKSVSTRWPPIRRSNCKLEF